MLSCCHRAAAKSKAILAAGKALRLAFYNYVFDVVFVALVVLPLDEWLL